MARAARNPDTGLTNREEAFAQILVDEPELSKSDAYRRVYSTARMKPETVNNKACVLANKANIRARVQQLRDERSERTGINSDYVLRRIAEIDQMDIGDILDDAGNVLPIKQWPKVWRTSVSGLDMHELMSGDTETIVKKLKWPDKARIIELLGKHVSVQAFKDQLALPAEGVTVVVNRPSGN